MKVTMGEVGGGGAWGQMVKLLADCKNHLWIKLPMNESNETQCGCP